MDAWIKVFETSILGEPTLVAPFEFCAKPFLLNGLGQCQAAIVTHDGNRRGKGHEVSKNSG